MKINYLKDFIVLSEIGNYQIAAEELFFSQPTLTRHIKLLEESLGATVFDRTTRKLELNEYGRLLLPYAKEIVRLYDEATELISNRQRNASSLVTVGSFPSLSLYSIAEILEHFNARCPELSIRIVEDGSPALLRLLEKDLCDFAFVRRFRTDIDKDDEIVSVPLASDRMVALIPDGHPLAKCEALSIARLRGESLLMPKGDMFYRRLLSAFSRAGFQPNISFVGSRTEDVAELVRKGMGIAFTLRSSCRTLNSQGISIHDLDEEFIMDIILSYPKGKELNPPCIRFLESVNEWLAKQSNTSDGSEAE